ADRAAYDDQGALFVALVPTPARSDLQAYRRIQTALELWSLEQPMRVLTVAGVRASESSAVVAGHLAVSLAGAGEAILLLETQVTKPSQARRFGIQGEAGLNRAVVTSSEWTGDRAGASAGYVMQFMYTATTLVAPNLRIMPAGSPWANTERVIRSA